MSAAAPAARISLGYFSADFREHPASHLLAGLFEQHDRTRFEVFGISYGHDDGSPMRRRIAAGFEHFIDVRGLGDGEIAAAARRLGVEIAVDLMGHTGGSRPGIFAHRAAPLQVNYFCPGTSGSPWHDYIVCDPVVVPEAHRAAYSEAVVHLPGTFQANDFRRHRLGAPPSRAALGLPQEGIVLCSFNAGYKLSPETFAIWMRLLAKVEDSVLWLRAADPVAMANLRAEAAGRGVDPERLVFAGRADPMTRHLERLQQADLFLDSFPYNAQTSASDALWAGVPVLTCAGATFSSRVAASLLTAAGLPELIATSLSAYEDLALRLASDRSALAGLKAKLVASRPASALFDLDRTCRDLETAYRLMSERHRRGLPPAGFAVPGLSA
jgi:predicted O-linked N-acetylglucosamine transferase (SPINDLY family)